MFDLIFSKLSGSDAPGPSDVPGPEVLIIDATSIKAHPTASSLNKGGPLRLHLSEGQCSDFTGADVLPKGLPPIEMLFSRQKDWRRIAVRYDRCAPIFRSAILLAAIILFW